MDFYQLNTLSTYSFGDSIVTIDKYCAECANKGYKGVAISDKNIFAYPSFEVACRKYGLKPIFGLRIKIPTPYKPLEGSLYIKDEQGYQNILSILANREMTLGTDYLSSISKGLILVIDCQDIRFYSKNYLASLSPLFTTLRKIFNDDLFFGITLRTSDDKDNVVNLYEYLDDNEYHSLAFPLVTYLHKDDYHAYQIINYSARKEKIKETILTGPDFLLSKKVVGDLYREADIENERILADKCNFTLLKRRGKLLSFSNADSILSDLAYKGLSKRVINFDEKYSQRLSYELNIITNMQFSSYFLIVADYVNFAKSQNIKVGPGRGSACGSLVAYSLSITDIDPLKYDLSFERFLNPKRVSMPDIDIDFEDVRREEVINYIKRKYGEENVADIITFSSLKPKSALNKIADALDIPSSRIKKLTDTIPDSASNFEDCKNDKYRSERFLALYQDDYYKNLIDLAEKLLSVIVNSSKHAAGLIISDKSIYQSCPMSLGKRGTVQFEYAYMESMGFLKVDILGLKNLSFLKEIEKNIPLKIDIEKHLDDAQVYKLVNKLDLAYIFQLDSYLMKRTIEIIKPTSFKDLTAIIAINRPGPNKYIPLYSERKNKEVQVTYSHPILEEILKDTYGIIIYQEQVIKIAQTLGGLSKEDAGLFQRAISKKNEDKILSFSKAFINGCLKNGMSEEEANKLFEDLKRFGYFGFNKSHAYAYSLLTFTFLYYKTYYEEAFYLAALKESSLNSDETYNVLKELYNRGYSLSSCNINYSLADDFLFRDKQIYIPLNRINQLDYHLAEVIIQERKNGRYTSIYNFFKRIIPLVDDKVSFIPLIDSGALDDLCEAREYLRENIKEIKDFIKMGFKEEQLPDLKDEEDVGNRLYLEKRALGVIISKKLSHIFSKENCKTMIITEITNNGLIKAIDGRKEHTIYTNYQNLQKNDFIAVRYNNNRYTILARKEVKNKYE